MHALGDHGLDNVDWPAELRLFKTADTTHYVVATATSAVACATCGTPFGFGDRRSLTVEVRIPEPAPPGPVCRHRQFAAEVHHRACRPPRLRVVTTAFDGATDDPLPGESDVYYALVTPSGKDGDHLPGLVFTTPDPVVLRDLDQAEGRSAWLSTYLALGFDLVGVGDLRWIGAHAPVTTAVEGSVHGVLFTLTGTIQDRQVPLLQWTRNGNHPAYRSWRRAVAARGSLLVVYGEYIHVDDAAGRVELAPGGRLGDIAAGVVRVDVTAPGGRHGGHAGRS